MNQLIPAGTLLEQDSTEFPLLCLPFKNNMNLKKAITSNRWFPFATDFSQTA